MAKRPQQKAQEKAPLPLLTMAWGASLAIIAGLGLWLQMSAGSREAAVDEHGATPAVETKDGDLHAAKPDAGGLNPVDPALMEPGPAGDIPKIAADGRKPFQHYARPHTAAEGRPQVAILITGLGMKEDVTSAALALDPAVSLSFSPYTQRVKDKVKAARASGHEVFADLPLEPLQFPQNDPGPLGLMVDGTPQEMTNRLGAVLAAVPGGVGVVSQMGSKFTTLEGPVGALMRSLKARGLAFVDARSTPYTVAAAGARAAQVPRAQSDKLIDATPDREEIDRQLAELEARAKATGFALGLAQPYPVSVEAVKAWSVALRERGVDLVPATAILDKQMIR